MEQGSSDDDPMSKEPLSGAPAQVLELLHEFGSMEKNFPSLLERQIQSFEQRWHFPMK